MKYKDKKSTSAGKTSLTVEIFPIHSSAIDHKYFNPQNYKLARPPFIGAATDAKFILRLIGNNCSEGKLYVI